MLLPIWGQAVSSQWVSAWWNLRHSCDPAASNHDDLNRNHLNMWSFNWHDEQGLWKTQHQAGLPRVRRRSRPPLRGSALLNPKFLQKFPELQGWEGGRPELNLQPRLIHLLHLQLPVQVKRGRGRPKLLPQLVPELCMMRIWGNSIANTWEPRNFFDLHIYCKFLSGSWLDSLIECTWSPSTT